MIPSRILALALGVLLLMSSRIPAQDSTPNPKDFLQKLGGTWEGTCRTWLQPGKLFDESSVSGEFKTIPGGRMIRHSYLGSMQAKPRSGEETIVFNSAMKKFQIAWFDDFHMSDGILFSEGDPTSTGFVVTAEYAMGPAQPVWRWKTVYELADADHLTITAYNITPDGKESKATETKYTRRKP